MVSTQLMIVIITPVSDFGSFLILKLSTLVPPVTNRSNHLDDHLKCMAMPNLSVNKYFNLDILLPF